MKITRGSVAVVFLALAALCGVIAVLSPVIAGLVAVLLYLDDFSLPIRDKSLVAQWWLGCACFIFPALMFLFAALKLKQ